LSIANDCPVIMFADISINEKKDKLNKNKKKY
jgi:hypothetical protein